MQDIEIGEIIEKLKDILASEGNRNVKTKDVAQALGINPDTFNSMKFRNSIPYPQILNFLQKRKININYFFYGISPKETLQCEDDYRILKLYKTNATLGGGGFNEEIEGLEVVFSNQILSILKSDNPKLITCMGDSMEPLISGESILFYSNSHSINFIVDLNGNSKPNQLGIDLHFFSFNTGKNYMEILPGPTWSNNTTNQQGAKLCQREIGWGWFAGANCGYWILRHDNMDYLHMSDEEIIEEW